MKPWALGIISVLFLTMPSPNHATEPVQKAKELLTQAGPIAELRQNLHAYMSSGKAKGEELKFKQEMGQYKSPAKGSIFSAALPGAGQFYNGSKVKGMFFLLVEAAAIAGHFHFLNKGNDFESDFQNLANREWNETAYWDWISQVSGVDRQNDAALREFESANFSHFLPQKKGQQYYENIGKYNQFVYGWTDFRKEVGDVENFSFGQYQGNSYNGTRLEDISPTRVEYMQIRTDSNNNLKHATALVTLTFLNHIVSAFEAGLSAKRYNRKLHASMKLDGFLYDKKVVPALALGITW